MPVSGTSGGASRDIQGTAAELSASQSLATQRLGAQTRLPVGTNVVYVEVGDPGTKANITRGGAGLAELQVNTEAITSYLDGLRAIPTKVVTQSIAPGVTVARGTVIDVTLAQVDQLPLGVVASVHPGLAGFTVDQATTAFLTPEVKDILRRRTDPADLTTAEKSTITAVLNTREISVTDDGAGSLTNAYTGLQAAFQFAG